MCMYGHPEERRSKIDNHCIDCHKLAQRRYRRRIKYGAKRIGWKLKEDRFRELALRYVRRHYRRQGISSGITVVLGLVGSGYNSITQVLRYNLNIKTRAKFCDFFNVGNNELFERIIL